jgi:hypothetical protein
MGFNGNAVAHLKFIHPFAQGAYDAGIFVTGDKIAVRRLPGQRFIHQGHIGTAARTGFDLKQDFHGSGFRCWDLLDLQMVALR